MTRESILAGERIDTTMYSIIAGTPVVVDGVGPNASRVAISFSSTADGWAADTDCAMIGVMQGGAFIALGAISPGMPSLRLSVDMVGSILRGRLYVLIFAAGGKTVSIADHFLTSDLR